MTRSVASVPVKHDRSRLVPSPDTDLGFSLVVATRITVLLVLGLLLTAIALENGSGAWPWVPVAILVAVIFLVPGALLWLVRRARSPRLVEAFLLVMPVWSAHVESRSLRLFHAALSLVGHPLPPPAGIDRLASALDTAPRAGPMWLASTALVHALRGNFDEARAVLLDVLTLDAAPSSWEQSFLAGRISSFVRTFACTELVLEHMRCGAWRELIQLDVQAKDSETIYGAEIARRFLGMHPELSPLALRCLRYVTPSMWRTGPLLARALAFEPLPLRIDRVVPEDLPAIFARAAHLGRVVDESARLAEAIMIADAFERASASGEVHSEIEKRLARSGGTGDASRAERALSDALDSLLTTALDGVPIRKELVLEVPRLAEIVERRISATFTELDIMAREYVATATEAPNPRYARSVRAFRKIRELHASLLACDPRSAREAYRLLRVRVWNRSIEVGDAEGNWLLAYAAFGFLAREAEAIGESEDALLLRRNQSHYLKP